jgi:hypothetical protein
MSDAGAKSLSSQTVNLSPAELAKRDAIHARFDAADVQQADAAAKAGVSKEAATVITTQGADGQRTITIPDGKGGSTTIVMDKNGVAVGGRLALPATRMPMNGASSRDIPPGVAALLNNGMTAFVLVVIGFPFARAIARLIDRRSEAPRADTDTTQRLRAIENAVESIALEVERISEGQRFTARVLTERATQPAPDFVGNGVREKAERANG